MDEFNGFRCVCSPGYKGELCVINEDDCDPDPCKNGAFCEDFVNDFKCHCPDDFYGKKCDHTTDHCATNPCKNNGTCDSTTKGYSCTCLSGYKGFNCETFVGQPGSIHENPRVGEISKESSQSSEFSLRDIILIICLGVGIPIVLILIGVVIFLLRRRRVPDTSDEDAKRENEANHAKSMNNKFLDCDVMIRHPSNVNSCPKNINELQDNSKQINLKGNSLEFITEKPIYNKHLIKNDLQTIDEQVQIQEKRFLNSSEIDSGGFSNVICKYEPVDCAGHRGNSNRNIDLDSLSIEDR